MMSVGLKFKYNGPKIKYLLICFSISELLTTTEQNYPVFNDICMEAYPLPHSLGLLCYKAGGNLEKKRYIEVTINFIIGRLARAHSLVQLLANISCIKSIYKFSKGCQYTFI